MHTHTDTDTHTHTHTHKHTLRHKYTQTHTQTQTNRQTDWLTHTHIHKHTHTHKHTYTHSDTHTHTHTHTQTHSHTHTQTHTHTWGAYHQEKWACPIATTTPVWHGTLAAGNRWPAEWSPNTPAALVTTQNTLALPSASRSWTRLVPSDPECLLLCLCQQNVFAFIQVWEGQNGQGLGQDGRRQQV